MDKWTEMPIVDCDSFIMRPIQIGDAEDLYDYGKRIEVTKRLTWGPLSSVEEAEQAITNVFLTRPEKNMPIGYAIVWQENNKMLGTCDFHTFSDGQQSAEIGYVIHIDYWGKGIMTRALGELVRIGFEFYDLERIQIRHAIDNNGSRRVIEKNGFIKEGLLRHAEKREDGQFYDHILYSLLKSDYEAMRR